MSVLGPEIHNALSQLLQMLSSPDNSVRSAAEEQLNTDWIAHRPDVLLMGLVEQMLDSTDPSVSMSPYAQHVTLLTAQDTILRRRPVPPHVH